MKTCRVCKQDMPLTEFHVDRSAKSGTRSLCKPCDHKQAKKWQHAHADHMRAYRRNWLKENPEKVSAAMRRGRKKNRAKCLVRAAKMRAAEKGVPFDLDTHLPEIQALMDAGVCQMTGLPFNLDSVRGWDSPSLDRIQPEKGYVWGNVRLICHGMNCALGTWGETQLRTFATAWLNKG